MNKLATLNGGGLRVDFERVGDRLMHTISAVSGCHLVPLLRSIEGTPDESWPASPAFQELHLEKREADLELALLVGLAGTSHWSASIGLDRASKSLHCDIACRVRDATARLITTYEILADVADLQPTAIQLASPHGGANLRGEGATFVCQENRLQIVPQTPPAAKLPDTIRWQYFVSPRS